jgi:hypothetical protein
VGATPIHLVSFGDIVVAVEAGVPYWSAPGADTEGAAWISTNGVAWRRSDAMDNTPGIDTFPPFFNIVSFGDVIFALASPGDLWMAFLAPSE